MKFLNVTRLFVVLAFLFSQTALTKERECSTGSYTYGKNSDYILDVADNEIKIMSYNVENLFDAQHDEGRDDYEYLPLSSPEKEKCDFKTGYYKQLCKTTDWTEDKIEIKLDQIARVVSSVGELPDILVLNEIENVNIVAHLADHLGYKKFLISSGSDKRIELGLLYNEHKIKLKEMREIQIKFPEEVHIKSTRNILVANFTSKSNPGEILGVYVNHWPSQSAPSKARVVAAKHLQKLLDTNVRKYGDKYHAIVAGDFNTIDKDNPHPFKTVVQNESWENSLEDLHEVYMNSAHKYDLKKMKSKMPKGTYFYGKDMAWNRLDRFFVTKNLLDDERVEIMAHNYRIVAPSFLLTTYYNNITKNDNFGNCMRGIPKRYNHNATTIDKAGFSDHFPIMTTVKF